MNNLTGRIFTSNQTGPIQIISADAIEVFYEPWSSLGWYYANTISAIFGRIPSDYFKENFIVLLDHSLPPNDNISRFYPHLPLRLLRYPNLFWSESSFNSIKDFRNFCKSQNIQIDDNIVLNTQEVYLDPISALGRTYNGSLLQSIRKDGFTSEELLFHAFRIQSKYVRPKQTSIQYERYGPIHSGIGLYRLGIRSNKPTYYIASYHDKAENTLRTENMNA